jgi:hypothetical protein
MWLLKIITSAYQSKLPITELYYITGGPARQKKVKPKTWGFRPLLTPFPWQLVRISHCNYQYTTSFPGLSCEDEGRDQKALVWAGQFCFGLGNTILPKNNWTWQLTILRISQHLYFYDSCVHEYVLQNNLSK